MSDLQITRCNGEVFTTLFDGDDLSLIGPHVWSAVKIDHTYYAVANLRSPARGPLYMHRLILPVNRGVEHVNGNGLDNRRLNLQAVNKRRPKKHQAHINSGHMGVAWDGRRQRWSVQCAGVWGGYYVDKDEAGLTYNELARVIFGQYAQLNDINVEASQ